MAKHSPDLDRIFQALSDPTRRAFLARMAEGPISVSSLAEPTGFSLPTVMKHLEVMELADLIETSKSGRVRICAARPQTLAAVSSWLREQQELWEARTDRLEAYVESLMKGQESDP